MDMENDIEYYQMTVYNYTDTLFNVILNRNVYKTVVVQGFQFKYPQEHLQFQTALSDADVMFADGGSQVVVNITVYNLDLLVDIVFEAY